MSLRWIPLALCLAVVACARPPEEQTGAAATSAAPVRAGDGAWTAVSVGQAQACGLIDQRLECWGSDEFGAVGDGPPIGATQPTPPRCGV